MQEFMKKISCLQPIDPTTKSLDLSGGQTILMTDTVGFIRKLPHHLVEAFKSTLEEAKYSDLILHVVEHPIRRKRNRWKQSMIH